MHRREDAEITLVTQTVDEIQDVLLMTDVERGRRLVEQQHGGLLRERPGDDHALAFTAGERIDGARRELPELEGVERGARGVDVRPADRPEDPVMGRAAEEHVVEHPHPGRDDGRLRDDRDGARPIAITHLLDGRPHHPDRTGLRRQHPGQRPQQRGLPRAVRPEDAHPFVRRDRQRHAVEEASPVALDRDAGTRESLTHPVVPLLVRSTTTKNGAPTIAVTTPIGISAGDSAVRASTSAKARKAPPRMIDSGTITR